ncbi:hypothetical protein [Streptomyces sp. NPDC049585]|uniref:hypothetical protein n=1 Tax=Streptomyces sp. NPDC049585 TaxID=3155154 RepID=UPI0034234164
MTTPATPAAVPAPPVAPALRTLAASLGVCALWAAAVWTAVHLRADPLLHDVALFVHLASLVVGFGAVLTVDWLGLLWLAGKRPLAEVLRTSAAVHPPIWLGLAGLVGSGVLLQPSLSAPLTQVKLALVLLVALNGIHAHVLQERLTTTARVGRALLVRCGATVLVSQLGWWGATLIGFLNSRR